MILKKKRFILFTFSPFQQCGSVTHLSAIQLIKSTTQKKYFFKRQNRENMCDGSGRFSLSLEDSTLWFRR